jgi:ferrous iron transport protein B
VHLDGAKELLAWLDSDAAHQLQAPALEGRSQARRAQHACQLLALHQQVAAIMRRRAGAAGGQPA